MIIQIDPNSQEPLYRQLRTQIILGLAQGNLQLGEQLPSVRQLAEELGMNMMTVSKAYNALKDDGYLVTDRRTGTKVADSIPKTDTHFPEELTVILADSFNRGMSEEAVIKEIQCIFNNFKKDVAK